MNDPSATGLLLASALALVACAASTAAPPVRLVAGDSRPVEIESTAIASNGRSAEVRVAAPRGIFALDLELAEGAGARLERLVLLVADERYCEGLEAEIPEATGRPARIVDLRHHADVAITQRGPDLEVSLGPAALAAVRPRARLQFVNQWR